MFDPPPAGLQSEIHVLDLVKVGIHVAYWKNALRICLCGEDLNQNPRYELNGQERLACNLNLIFSI